MESPPPPAPETGVLTHWVFRRVLAFSHLWAFGSLWAQIQGLVGPRGIRPAAETLENAAEALAARELNRWLEMPTLAWFTGADAAALHLLCGAGMVAALLLLFDRLALPSLAALYLLYLSLFHICGEFLHYQWDILLMEVTFAALLYTPRLPLSVWLPRGILFKLMLSSGVVKLASGDPTWRDLTALDFHYWTQPIPHLGGWLAWRMPGHAVSCVLMFAVELAVPLLVLVRPFWAFWPFTALLSVMFGTGNYGFFHLLTFALCVTLVPDARWRRWLRGRVEPPAPKPPTRATWLLAAPIAWLLLLCLLHLGMLGPRRARPEAVVDLYRTLAGPLDAWQLESGYGLFASMTTERLEIQVEGSADGGRTWRPYRFRYKPLEAADLPPPALFHMPRLEWQMWFAALGTCRHNEWFVRFQKRLLEGSPEVRALLSEDPFPEGPPGLVRSRTESFRFAVGDTPWQVEPGGPYCPTLSLDRFR